MPTSSTAKTRPAKKAAAASKVRGRPDDRRRKFGAALRAARTTADMSQDRLGAQVGKTQAAIAAWETGENVPEPDVVFRLERVLGLSAGQLSQHLGFVPAGTASVGQDVISAIVADRRLTESMRTALIAAYQALVG